MSKLRKILVFFGLVRMTEEEHIQHCPWCRAAIRNEKKGANQ